MYDAFISYAREDRARASELADALVALRGWSVWWDSNVHTGDPFARRIETALARSRCVIVIWSRHSVDSDWVRAEAAEGWERGVLVPVRFDDSEPPLPFRQTQTADLSGWGGSHKTPQLLALIEDIERIHAQSEAAGTTELAQRQARQRAARLRSTLRGVLVALVLLGVLAGGWFAFGSYTKRQADRAHSAQLAAQARGLRDAVLARTPEEEKAIWWYLIFEDRSRIATLETSILLAIEALRIAPGAEAERALRESLVLLPWSDWRLELESGVHVGALRFSHDGRLLAAGGGGGDTLVWDFRAGDVLARIAHGGTGTTGTWDGPRGERTVYRGPQVLDFSPGSDVLATAGPDRSVRVWDARGGEQLAYLEHPDVAVVVRFNPGGGTLASASADGSVFLWSLDTGKVLASMKHADEVFDLAFSPAGNLLASASRDGSAIVWRMPAGDIVAEFKNEVAAKGVRFSPDGRFLATFGPDVDTTFWSIEHSQPVWQLPVASAGDAGPVFAPDNDTFVLGAVNGELGRWSLSRKQAVFSADHGGYIGSSVADAGRRRLVTRSSDETARAWDLASGRELKRMPYAGWLSAIAVTPDGEWMGASGYDPWGQPVLEVTRTWPADPVTSACAQMSRNLSRNEWREYLPDIPYRETCEGVESP